MSQKPITNRGSWQLVAISLPAALCAIVWVGSGLRPRRAENRVSREATEASVNGGGRLVRDVDRPLLASNGNPIVQKARPSAADAEYCRRIARTVHDAVADTLKDRLIGAAVGVGGAMGGGAIADARAAEVYEACARSNRP